VTEHLSDDELADADAGLLEGARGAEVSEHLGSCRPCAERMEQLRRVSDVLAAAPPAKMPAEVSARLDAVLAVEASARETRARETRAREMRETKQEFAEAPAESIGLVDRTAKPSLQQAPPVGPQRWRRAAGVVLISAASAAAIGAAGYALSNAAGLNEPNAAAPVYVESSQLAEQARAIEDSGELSAHTFSGAWRCARTVTSGRITGLTPAVVDGSPALLVYTQQSGATWVTVVTGCPRPGALAQEPVRLP
jgi:hypothetical protein